MRYLIAFLCVVAMGVVLTVGCANLGPGGTGGMDGNGGMDGIGGTSGCTGGQCDGVPEAKAFCQLAIDSCNVHAADGPQSATLCDSLGYDIFCGGGGGGGEGGVGGGGAQPFADCDGITCQMTPDLRAQCDEFADQCTLFCLNEGCSIDCLGIAELMFCSVEE